MAYVVEDVDDLVGYCDQLHIGKRAINGLCTLFEILHVRELGRIPISRLRAYSRIDLLRVKGLGKVALGEIMNELQRYGVKLRDMR